MMKPYQKILLIPTIILLALIHFNEVKAQNTSSWIDQSRVFTGGGLGVQIGSVTLIDVSPHIGYFITERFALGIGGTYQYYRINNDYINYSTSIWGGRLFGRYYVLEELFAHAEYEYLNYEAALVDPFGYYSGKIERVGVDNILVGAGYRQSIGGNSYVNLLVLWNLNETVYTLYENPIIRMGIDIGL